MEEITDVLVVGAGSAGMTLAQRLVRRGIDVILLEARDRVGGRTNLDLGGEFVHGGGALKDWAEEHHLPLLRTFCSFPPSPYFDDGREVSEFFWLPLENKLVDWVVGQQEDPDIALMVSVLSDLPETVNSSLYSYLASKLPLRVLGLAEAVYARTWATDLDQISVSSAAREDGKKHSDDVENYIFGEGRGMQALVNSLSHGLDIRLNHKVVSVAPNSVTLENGRVFRAKRAVVVAVPITQVTQLHFSPPLPLDLRSRLQFSEMGSAMKLITRFDRRFWPERMLLCFCADSLVSQIWMSPKSGVLTITGFISGRSALSLRDEEEHLILHAFLKQLDVMFKTDAASSSYVEHVFESWVESAYSHPTVTQNAQEELSTLQHPVFFIGEHCPPSGEIGTVTAAMHSGNQLASKL